MYSKNDLTVNVNKKDLLRRLKNNRLNHAAELKSANFGFRKLLIEELEDKLEAAKANEKVELRFENQKPQNNLNDYDDVIGMLELATNDSIELNHSQYKQYVNDEWDWKDMWSTSNVAYLSAAL